MNALLTHSPADPVINTCRCCHTAYDVESFDKLKLCGTKGYIFGDTAVIEVYRNCECGSTLMVFIEKPARADS